ncbi:TPA: recombinase family protein [Staphylococcus aureus]|nr:recombinase family protein [Staphylococcus aureus]HDK7538681.1 recombinase family protein [Staphylococcus aureus]HDK7756247.1 recombinase family protein [Staphylococcus aureus]
MKVAIYTRVSSAEQANEGYSIHEQKRKLISFCEVNDWDRYEVFSDPGVSGGSMKRPSLQKLFDRLEEFDLVLVYKLDRLTRNVRDLLEMLEVLVDQKLKPNQYAEYIRFIVDKLLSGKSANEVVRLLESKKKPPGITKWNRKTVLGWMRNPILRGHTKHGDLLIKNTHEPIISEDEHSKMLDIIDKRTHKSKTKHNSIFRGVIECPQCQNKLYLVSSIQKRANGGSYEVRRYTCATCHKNKEVKDVSFNESEIEREFINTLLKKGTDNFMVNIPKPKDYDIENNKEKILEQRANYTRAWSLGYIKDEEYFVLMDETDKLLKDIEEKESPRINIELNEQQIRSVKNLLIKGFKMATAENKEELITSTVDLIKIDFIPRRLNKEGNINTVKINEIHFKY